MMNIPVNVERRLQKMLQEWLKKLLHGLEDITKFLALTWDKLKSERIGTQSINPDIAFYEKERNYHEQQIMDINDLVQQLEEERARHEYFYNVADSMYSQLIQKEQN